MVSFGVPYIDAEDPRCKPRPAIALGKGSYVKVVGREGTMSKKMIIVGTIGIQLDKAEIQNLDSRNLTATRALGEASDAEDEEAGAISVVGYATTQSTSARQGGLDPTVCSRVCIGAVEEPPERGWPRGPVGDGGCYSS